MPTPLIIRACLQDLAEPAIFRRGIIYYAKQAVGVLNIKRSRPSLIQVQAKVDGSESYETSFTFDKEKKKIKDSTCSCPYGDVCKHIVALGLAYASSLEKNTVSQEEDHVRKTLRELGLSSKEIPQTLITEFLADKKQTDPQKSSSIVQSFDPKDYFILLATHQNYTPTLHRKDQPFQQASINALLTRTDLTETQRALFAYMKQGWVRDGLSAPDLTQLFPLLVTSEISIYKNAYTLHQRPLVIDLQPKQLHAEIRYRPASSQQDQGRIHPHFLFRMPTEDWSKHGSSQTLSLQRNCALRETKESLELHALTEDLVELLSRLQPDHEHATSEGHAGTFFEALLSEAEVTRLEYIIRDAKRYLTLLSPPPAITVRASIICTPAFLVDYRSKAAFLEITPVIDYGIHKQPISKNVYVSHRSPRHIVKHREGSSDTYFFSLQDNVLSYAKVDEEQEKEFYHQLRQEAEELGFTKTLKCLHKGTPDLQAYLQSYWSMLTEYAALENISILFSHEPLTLEQADFRAEFKTDLRADRDWLSFDLACYCGEEPLTLEKLSSYLESGEPFYRREDGTLITIANRDALERLARLLKNFQVQEDGEFVGRLYHAPELEYVMTSSPHYNAIRAKSFQAFMEDVQQGKPIHRVRLPKNFATILRPYQKDGVDWLHFLRSYHFAGILADDMGLGKTIQTLALLAMQRMKGKPSLVVCPKTLIYNWKLEAEKYTPALKILVIEGLQKERRLQYDHSTDYDLVILSYSTLKQDEAQLTHPDRSFNYVVLDEAQYIKNHATKGAQVVKKLKADYRLALTGTPFENSVSEIWSIFDFLMPGFLGTYEQFFKRFQKPIMEESDQEALEHLRQKVKSFMLRRTKSEVLKELPAKIEQVSACHLSDSQTILYQDILAKVRGDVLETVKRQGFKRSQIHILAALTKLRQACNHPALLTRNKDWRAYESAKLDTCLELIDEVIQGKHKVLIFSQFTSMLDIVSEALEDRDIPHLYLSGKTQHRQRMVDAFNQDPTIPVFLISLKAGGTGLNLTAADTVIIFDPWWNPSVENQAIDRAHRIGQKQTVNVYRLLTLGTIEEKIQALKQKKQTLFNALVGESQDLFKKLSWEDLKELFT